jgi:hypothetical protein
MGICLRPSRLLKLRISKRGTRVGLGPRWLRFWGGKGDRGVST